MRRKDESKKSIIANYINDFFYEHDKVPSVREIVEGTGIPLSTVHRYLRDMQEKGELSYVESRSLLQIGQPAPFTRCLEQAVHSCPFSQRHQQSFLLLGFRSQGFKSPFFVGCHSAAISGLSDARSFSPRIGFVPAQ